MRRPIVPPIVESFVSKFDFSSLVIRSKVWVSKKILTKKRLVGSLFLSRTKRRLVKSKDDFLAVYVSAI